MIIIIHPSSRICGKNWMAWCDRKVPSSVLSINKWLSNCVNRCFHFPSWNSRTSLPSIEGLFESPNLILNLRVHLWIFSCWQLSSLSTSRNPVLGRQQWCRALSSLCINRHPSASHKTRGVGIKSCKEQSRNNAGALHLLGTQWLLGWRVKRE